MKLKRRTFLKLSTAAGVGSALVPMTFKALAKSDGEEEWIPGVPQWKNSVCLQCEGGCGIKVKLIEGNAKKIEGNPLHPINEGRLCPKGQSGLHVVYDPDRIKGPMKRERRGSDNWKTISWAEAIKTVADNLRGLRETGQAHTLLVMGGRYRGQMHPLMKRFLEAFGSPNDVGHGSICCDGSRIAHYLTQGIRDYAAYDWDNTNYILCFGASFLEAWRPTTRLLRAYGHIRRERVGSRAKLVEIDPRFSVSAAKADEWVPINPGTDAALALGIAHVIIKEGLHDKDFVENHTFGLEDWDDESGKKHTGFKTMVLDEYSPGAVSEITGVPAERIERLAKEFATTQPGIASGERGTSAQSNGIYTRMAIHSLNALVGSIDVPGGVLVQEYPPFAPWPEVEKDPPAQKGLSMPRIDRAGSKEFPLASSVYAAVPESILNENPYKIHAVFLYYTNPLFSSPNPARFRKAFEKVPFIVSFSPFMDESTDRSADIILPDHTYLERWQDDIIPASMGYPAFGIRQPVVEPLYDTMNTGDAIIKIAQQIGGSVADAFRWKDFKGAIKDAVKGVQKAKRGSISTSSATRFWKKLLENGGWWDKDYKFGQWERVLRTPSGRFEFHSQHLKNDLEKIAKVEAEKNNTSFEHEMGEMLKCLRIEARGDKLFMPHYEPVRYAGNEREYPFHLNTYKLMPHAEGRGANQPWLQEILGEHVNEKWESWVEINPDTAKGLGIADKDLVWIESPLGRLKVRARLYQGAMPNVLSMPFENGHKAYGRWAKDRGANPNAILADEYDRLGGFAAFFSTKVKVYKALS